MHKIQRIFTRPTLAGLSEQLYDDDKFRFSLRICFWWQESMLSGVLEGVWVVSCNPHTTEGCNTEVQPFESVIKPQKLATF